MFEEIAYDAKNVESMQKHKELSDLETDGLKNYLTNPNRWNEEQPERSVADTDYK